MGKISQGILDGISGKVGNIVGASWKGIDYVRIKPDHVANPNTEAQANHRAKFKGVTSLAKKIMSPIIRPIWNRSAVKMTGYNLFVQKNIDAFGIDGTIEDYAKLSLSTGSLDLPDGISVTADDMVESGIKVRWDNSLGQGSNDDKLKLVAVNDIDSSIFLLLDLPYTRAESSADVVLPFDARTDVHVYVFFGNSTNREFSPSEHAALTL